MWIWYKIIKPILEAVSHFETASTIQAFLWPFILTAATAMSGYLGHIPVMWIIMAATLTFMGAAVGILSASQYRERRNPLNKIVIRNTMFPHDLATAPQSHSRQVRRGMAKADVVVLLPPRRILKGQIAVEIVNTSSFPISIIVFSAKTSIEGKTPPRTEYPKQATLIQPGGGGLPMGIRSAPSWRLSRRVGLAWISAGIGSDTSVHFDGNPPKK